MPRPNSLPKGTVYYYDEQAPTPKWLAGMREVRAWERHSGKTMDELGSTDDMLFLAYMSLKRDGLLPSLEEVDNGSAVNGVIEFESWADTVMWLFDDDKSASPAGEGSAPTA